MLKNKYKITIPSVMTSGISIFDKIEFKPITHLFKIGGRGKEESIAQQYAEIYDIAQGIAQQETKQKLYADSTLTGEKIISSINEIRELHITRMLKLSVILLEKKLL